MEALISIVVALAAGSAGARYAGVDWANRDYGRHMQLTDGRYTMRRYPARGTAVARRCRHTTQSARLVDTQFGDLDGDREPEAVVRINTYTDFCNGNPSERDVFVVFTRRRGAVVELGRTSVAWVTGAAIKGRALRVTRREPTASGWKRCDDRWRWRRGTLELARSRCR